MLNLIDQRIRRAFSDAAVQYDVLTSLHKEIGRELVRKVKDREDCTHILDVGMGTGWLTNRLANFFPDTEVAGLDFAAGMIEAAQNQNDGFRIIQADAAHLPFKKGIFDIVISNLAYQWVADLPKAFREAHDRIKSNGVFCATMFGQQTLDELFIALEKTWDARNEKRELPIRRLPDASLIRTAMEQAGFREITMDTEKITVHFPDMFALLKWVKDIGANALKKEVFVGREWLLRASEYYFKEFRDRFGVSSTFEVVWVEGKKE